MSNYKLQEKFLIDSNGHLICMINSCNYYMIVMYWRENTTILNWTIWTVMKMLCIFSTILLLNVNIQNHLMKMLRKVENSINWIMSNYSKISFCHLKYKIRLSKFQILKLMVIYVNIMDKSIEKLSPSLTE